MDKNFFQESLFRMGTLNPITSEFSKDKVVEAYVVLDGPNDPDEAMRLNKKQLSLFSKEKDVIDYVWQEAKAKEGPLP